MHLQKSLKGEKYVSSSDDSKFFNARQYEQTRLNLRNMESQELQ